MQRTIVAAALFTAFAACAQAPAASDVARHKHALATCGDCGTVLSVEKVKRKGEGGAVGIVAGAAAGGLLGNQVGGGTGNTLATVGGAVAGGFVGNEVQKRVTAKDVWVTRVQLKDGTTRAFEQDKQPAWKAGSVVRVQGKALGSV